MSHDNLSAHFLELSNASVRRLCEEGNEFQELLEDATGLGRKLRSVLAMNFWKWSGWDLSPDRFLLLQEDLASIEMLHSASCVFDDIIDGDRVRRGVESFFVRRGQDQAILSGLKMITTSVIGREQTDERPELSALRQATRGKIRDQLIRYVDETVIGEGYDTFLLAQKKYADMPMSSATNKYFGKTSPPFGLAHEFVAYYAEQPEVKCKAANEYGRALGKFYQTANDHYDVMHIDAKVRGDANDEVLMTFGVPLGLYIDQYPEYRKWIGEKIPRDTLSARIEQMKKSGLESRSREFLDARKSEVLDRYPCGEPPAGLMDLLQKVDSAHFWSYSYASTTPPT